MKYILTTLMTILFLNLYSQVEYPRIEQDSLGQSIVLMTIEQAQEIDNKLELLSLFEKLNVQMGTYDSICIKVINSKEEVIATQDIQIKQLNVLNDNCELQIANMNQQILEYKEKEITYKKEIENKNKEIKLHLDKISEQKTKMIIGSGVAGSIIVGLVSIIISIAN